MYTHEQGTAENHIHLLLQSVPSYSPTKIIKTVKSITAREIFEKHLEVKKKLWGGHFWTSGYYVNTVGQHGSFDTIQEYVKNQGKTYKKIYRSQLKLF